MSRTEQEVSVESELLAMVEALRLLLKQDDVFWQPEESAADVLPALHALEREVRAAAVDPVRAEPALGRLRELRIWVDRLYAPRGADGESATARATFHETRVRALAALQELRDALTRYFDALFGRTAR